MTKLEAKPGGPTKQPSTPGDGEASKGAAKKEALGLGRELLAKQAAAAGVHIIYRIECVSGSPQCLLSEKPDR